MPIVRKTTSAIGLAIVNDVSKFIQQNADGMSKDTKLTSKDGADAMANAICYAIAKALNTPAFKTAFDTGMVPTVTGVGVPAIVPTGPTIYGALQPKCIEI